MRCYAADGLLAGGPGHRRGTGGNGVVDEACDEDVAEVELDATSPRPGSKPSSPPSAAAVAPGEQRSPRLRRSNDLIAAGGGAQTRILKSIIQSLPDGVLVADREGRLLLVNSTAQRMVGPGPYDVSLAEWPRVYGCFLADGVTPYPPEALPLARALRGETVADAEILLRNPWVPNGVWLSASSTPWKDHLGTPAGGVMVLRDISEHKKSSDMIQRLSSAVEQTADSVFITDMEGTIVYVNPAFEEIMGYPRAEALGQTPRLLKSGEHDATFYSQIWDTVLAGGVFRGVVINRRRNGQLFHCEQTITPIQAPDGRRTNLLSVARDITGRRLAEHEQIEMHLARGVQQRLYPRAPAKVPGLDVAGAVYPAATMCGDYFDYFPMPHDGLGLAIGDVSGHGMGPSLIMAQTRAYLRSIALTNTDVGEVLRQVNRVLVSDLDVDRFVTLALVHVAPRALTLVHANAGHLPGYLLDRRGEVREVLASTGLPLGLFLEGRFSSGPVVTLEPGDMLVLFTDGITESGGYEGEEEFGAERALELIRTHRHRAAGEIARELCRSAQAFAPRGPQVDDMAVLICKVT